MKKRKVEAWAAFDSEGNVRLCSGNASVAKINSAHDWHVVRLVPADPLKERVYKAAMRLSRPHGEKEWNALITAVEAALKKG